MIPTPQQQARERLAKAGYWPMVPLRDGVELWADSEHVCAITSNDNPKELIGKIKTVMTMDEYRTRRKAQSK